jgi:NAD(P)-dependent dehydrogenase (short-subunit alcohol dehydrogenase family)
MPATHPTVLPERVVLITGAARRLGREMALHLARAGWQVAVHCHQSVTEAEQTARDCHAINGLPHKVLRADLNDESATRALIDQAVALFGRVDAVVNNASLFEHDEVASFSYELLQKHLRSNTAAPIALAQALHAHACARQAPAGAAVVVNLLDQKLWNPNPDFLSYTLSKAALEAANTLLAQALAPVVRVVGVAPGLTLTSHMLSQDKFEQLHQLSPLGRSSTPHDVAATVAFALDNASITGTTLLVDGGQHLRRFERDFSLM